jgi:cbb3-type cytochrome oxidase subunit 1
VVGLIFFKTIAGAKSTCKGGPFCQMRFGTVAFLVSGLLLLAASCPQISRVTQFTWFEQAQVQWQIFGFFTIVVMGGFNYLFPGVMGFEFPFAKLLRFQHWLFMGGAFLLLVSLVAAGILQGLNGYAFISALPALRLSTLGLLFLLLASLIFAANVFAMTLRWKLGLIKIVINAILAPLTATEVKS